MPTENPAVVQSDAIRTVEDRARLLRKIDQLNTELCQTIPPSEEYIQKTYPTVYTLILSQEGVSNTLLNQENLEKLKTNLLDMQELTINCPSRIDGKVEDIVYSWCQENVSKGILVSVYEDSTLTSGLTCSYNGNYRDFSLDRIIKSLVYD